MQHTLARFLVFWGLNTLVLWAAGELFASVHFDSWSALVLSGLLFGLAHALVKPLLVILTLPITLLTLGLFLLVINALLLLLVAWVVPGFHLTGFWHAVLVAVFISIFSSVLSHLIGMRK